ncbi:MAG: orotidine-5'-phosphate decarboxylase [Deltaproteobacteria bacterium]|nr:orotidine-5'-phosphate decarboxylase [Deltaproteobacteria bacterium]
MNKELLKRVIAAVDVPTFEEAKIVIDETRGRLEYVKIGMQSFFGYGEQIIPYARAQGFKIFLDLKLCDIPNTVSSAIKSLAKYGFDLLTVHVGGGEKMLRDATKTLKEILPTSGIIGVTILTSLSDDDVKSIGFRAGVREAITDMVALALDTGIYGIVCSASDLGFVKTLVGNRLKIITPGIRLPGDPALDQKRVESPLAAFESGADFIVVGRSLIEGDIKSNLDRLTQHLINRE